jgi:glycyl-tRNA synthetase beta chain
LRRAALGIIQILVAKKLDVDLRAAIELAALQQPVDVSPEARAALLDFIAGRLRAWVEEQDWPRDVIAAVLAEQSHNPYRAMQGLEQLSAWVKRPNWEQILDSFARCVRITRDDETVYAVNPDNFSEPQEKKLYEAYQKAADKLNTNDNVDTFLKAFEPMLPAITDFFDHVMVNAEDEATRQNRHGLLQAISAMQRSRADLSYLSGF